jgi:hypothetical protein
MEDLPKASVSPFLERTQKDPREGLVIFAETVEPRSLFIKEQEIKGDVLIAGHGGFVPERIFVATSESGFDEVKPEISSLLLIDDESSSNPEIYFSHANSRIKAQTCTLQEFAQQISEPKFDVVFFLRITTIENTLQKQLEKGLLSDIYRILKPGGLVIGSGGFVSEEEADQLLKTKFKVENLIALPNPDYSGYHYNAVHLGFKLRKS